MKIVLKTGEVVEARLMRENEDVFELTRFVNETRRTGPYLGERSAVTPEKEAEWVKRNVAEQRKGRAVYMLAARGDKMVGIASAACKTQHCHRHLAEFGWMIRPGWREKGLGYALGRIVLKKCVNKKKMPVIFSRVFSNNAPSAHLLKKLCFKKIARLPGFYKRGREVCDELFLVLDKNRFKRALLKQKA